LTIETNPNYNKDESPTTHCTPDLIKKSPLRQSKRRNIYLRAQSEEIKKVWQQLISQQVFNINNNGSDILINIPSSGLLSQTDLLKNVSTNKTQETEKISLFHQKSSYDQTNHTNSNQLNLKSQNAFDESLDDENVSHLKTPETPEISMANLSSLNGKIQQSLSFSSRIMNSDCADSEYGDIFDFGFDNASLELKEDLKENMFMQNDPFFADE
jgi:hypothetical protein